MSEERLPEIRTGILKKLSLVFTSFLALLCLCMGIFYWVRLMGVFPGGLWRFDLMPWHWRVLCSSLAVLYPVAASGLWMRSRWGIVLWLTGAVTETACMTVYSSYFSLNLWIPVLHVIFLACYGVLSLLIFVSKPRRLQTVVEY